MQTNNKIRGMIGKEPWKGAGWKMKRKERETEENVEVTCHREPYLLRLHPSQVFSTSRLLLFGSLDLSHLFVVFPATPLNPIFGHYTNETPM